jgi:hypothetical protein
VRRKFCHSTKCLILYHFVLCTWCCFTKHLDVCVYNYNVHVYIYIYMDVGGCGPFLTVV